jgi:DNA (cytosine-5)-methyltransferase 1
MKHGSLFSGIGGFDLAADWMGWQNVFHCEIAEFPRKILNHYWPNADCHEDIKKTDFTKYRGTVDIISGGFPCQPYSAAGKRLGKEDDRHLWPEMLRVIREVKPQWVVGENVRGLLNWNGGMVFHEVCADLENIGYEVQSFIIPASGINAPHQRERLWIVANSRHSPKGKTRSSITNEGEQSSIIHTYEQSRNQSAIFNNGFCDLQRDVADTDSSNNKTWTQREILGQQNRKKTNGYSDVECRNQWQKFPTQSPICGGDDGISHGLDNITFPKWRNESIKGYGNAVVPQVVYRIFKTIEYIQNLKQND